MKGVSERVKRLSQKTKSYSVKTYVVSRNKGIVHCDNVHHWIVLSSTHDQTSDTAESVDTNVDRLQRFGGSLAVDNVDKFWLQRSAAYKESINIGLLGESWSGCGIGRSSVQDTSVFGDIGTSNLSKVLANIGVRILSLFWCGGESSSNGPFIFINKNSMLDMTGKYRIDFLIKKSTHRLARRQ